MNNTDLLLLLCAWLVSGLVGLAGFTKSLNGFKWSENVLNCLILGPFALYLSLRLYWELQRFRKICAEFEKTVMKIEVEAEK